MMIGTVFSGLAGQVSPVVAAFVAIIEAVNAGELRVDGPASAHELADAGLVNWSTSGDSEESLALPSHAF